MSADDPLSRARIAAVDPDGLLAEILDLPEHLRDALWRVESANIAAQATPGGLAVVGVDGLQRGGELAREALLPDLAGPLSTWPGPPPEPSPRPTTTLLVSYSGEDPPVLEAFAAAADTRRVVLTTGGALAGAARGARVPVVPLPGGFPFPAAAMGYSLVVTLELARLAGLTGANRDRVETAAAHVARLARNWGPDSPVDSPLKRLAHTVDAGRASDWTPSPVEAGETPLQRVVTQLLLENLLALYRRALAA
ncbi:MAG TPA: hypothetical protein VFN48_10590 [Solirubrobacteraceae bacterium]|nr:hypothetical protein [Solirubrobacteraceae bacterium]